MTHDGKDSLARLCDLIDRLPAALGEEDYARVESSTLTAHGDLPRRATSPFAHTPGPWACHLDDDGFWVQPPVTSDPVICDLLPRDADVFTDEDEANARLIAAAPEMYAAVKAFFDADDPDDRQYSPAELRAIHLLRAALDKAEGRTK